jgi:hypothetical protein
MRGQQAVGACNVPGFIRISYLLEAIAGHQASGAPGTNSSWMPEVITIFAEKEVLMRCASTFVRMTCGACAVRYPVEVGKIVSTLC